MGPEAFASGPTSLCPDTSQRGRTRPRIGPCPPDRSDKPTQIRLQNVSGHAMACPDTAPSSGRDPARRPAQLRTRSFYRWWPSSGVTPPLDRLPEPVPWRGASGGRGATTFGHVVLRDRGARRSLFVLAGALARDLREPLLPPPRRCLGRAACGRLRGRCHAREQAPFARRNAPATQPLNLLFFRTHLRHVPYPTKRSCTLPTRISTSPPCSRPCATLTLPLKFYTPLAQ